MIKEPMNCGTKVLKFMVLGDPVGQGRPRFTTINGHPKAYDPRKSRDYKSLIKMLAAEAMRSQAWGYCEKAALKLSIVAYLRIPESKSKKFKLAAIEGKERPTKKPDCSNLVKGIEDAMNGVVYRDDSQIIELNVQKFYDVVPRTEVILEYAA